MSAGRHDAIDIAKGIGIILVVLGHHPALGDRPPLSVMIYSFHLLLFLLLSGAFLKASQGMGPFAMSRLDAILKPYLVVTACMGIVKAMGGFIPFADLEDARRYFYGLVYGTGTTVIWIPLWYLPHLVIASIACMVLLKGIGQRPTPVLGAAGVLLATGVFFLGQLPHLPWSADLLPISVAFMAAGWALRDRIAAVTFHWLPFTMALMAFLLLHRFFEGRIDLNDRVYDRLFVGTAQAALGIYLTLSVSSALQRWRPASRALGHVGAGSLFILIFHHPFLSRAVAALEARGVSGVTGLLLPLVAGIVFPLLMWEASKRIPLLTALLLPRRQAPNAMGVRPPPKAKAG